MRLLFEGILGKQGTPSQAHKQKYPLQKDGLSRTALSYASKPSLCRMLKPGCRLFLPNVSPHVSAVESLAFALASNFCITYFGAG